MKPAISISLPKLFIATLFCCALATDSFGQAPKSSLKKEFTYEFEQSSGTNASAVVWNPETKRYYTVIAGNPSYPLEAFDEYGKNRGYAEAGVDVRGMWYNPSTKELECNAEGDGGWFTLTLENGKPSGENEEIFEGELQPAAQSVGTFYPKKNEVVFQVEGFLHFYNRTKGEESRRIEITELPSLVDEINYTSVCYTGHKMYEFAILNFEEKEIYYINAKGKYVAKSSLPSSAITSDIFRFSFANDRVWLYDIDTRTWTGYKAF